MPDFTWSETAGRFRDDRGRFIPEARVRSGVDALVDAASGRATTLAAGVRSGSVSNADFQAGMFGIIKDVHIASGLAAYGGRNAMDASKWGFLGQRIRAQYGYARNLVSELVSGQQPMNGRLDVRAAMYAEAGRITYEVVRDRQERARGMTEGRNILHARESCPECIEITGRGWQPIEGIPPIGMRQCLVRCKCTIERR